VASITALRPEIPGELSSFGLLGHRNPASSAYPPAISILRAVLDDSARAKFAQNQFDDYGRDFVIYMLKMDGLDEGVLCAVGCEKTTTYTIERETAGTRKWIGLKLGNFIYFAGIADDLTFEPLPDRINRQGEPALRNFSRWPLLSRSRV